MRWRRLSPPVQSVGKADGDAAVERRCGCGIRHVPGGPAVACTVEVKPIAGKWHEKPRGWMSIQEQGREKGTMPTVWFAQMAAGEPAVPVKIRVKTEYGALFMHLTSYQGAGHTLKIARQ